MDENTARQLVLVRAYDAAASRGDSPIWSAEDASWATKLAAQTAPTGADPERFLAERARHALERILPRDRQAAQWLARSGWRWSWMLVALALGLLAGLSGGLLGKDNHVDVWALPAWGLVGWNLLVYAVMATLAVAALVRRRPVGPGAGLRRALAAWWRHASGQGPVREASQQWALLSSPQSMSRAGAWLHLAAAALAAGLVAGLYWRGLGVDFRAGWQSTFLDAETVQRTLALLLTPATALTGIAVPDIAGMEALRITPANPKPSASAAPWIHLYGAMLALVVVVPRLLLAAWALLRAAWQARCVSLPLDAPDLQALLQRRVGVDAVQVFPYVAAPAAQTALALRARLAAEFGEAVQVHLSEPVRMGDEDLAARRVAASPSRAAPGLHIAFVDLGATPEAEHHGRFLAALKQLAPGVPLRLLVDESAFVQRFAGLPERVEERRAAWRNFALEAGVEFMALDLGKA